MLASSSYYALLDELERYQLPDRVRREPPPPKKPPRPGVKPRDGIADGQVVISGCAGGLITHVGGDAAQALVALAEADGCRTAVAVAAWLNERGYRGRMGGEWSKQSVTRVSADRSQDAYEARLADHTASIREGLRRAKASGCHNRDRAAALNAQGLRTLSGQEWDRKSVARWWRAHATG